MVLMMHAGSWVTHAAATAAVICRTHVYGLQMVSQLMDTDAIVSISQQAAIADAAPGCFAIICFFRRAAVVLLPGGVLLLWEALS